jgi:hypothetical protein
VQIILPEHAVSAKTVYKDGQKYGKKGGKNGGKKGGGVGVVMLSEYEDHSEAPTPFTALTL